MSYKRQIITSIKLSFIIIFLFGFILRADSQYIISHIDSLASDDLVLYSQSFEKETYLVNKCGELINEWNHNERAGLSARLLPDGNLIRAGYLQNTCCPQASTGGLLQIINWDNNLIWQDTLANENETQHHDFLVLPNGNILYIGWEKIDTSEQIALGVEQIRSSLWLDFVREIKPIFPDSSEIIWQWRLRDHLIQDIFPNADNYRSSIKNHLGKIDINYIGPASVNPRGRWHVNSIDYNQERDEIILNTRENNELWIIDHSTSTIEAASDTGGNYGKGGQILFRWGNPQAYNRGSIDSLRMFGSHGLIWIEDDNILKDYILFFNNGDSRPNGNHSTVELIKPSIDNNGFYLINSDSIFQIDDHKLVYGEDPINQPLQSTYLSNCEKFENGYLINEGGRGRILEINDEKEIVWELKVTAGDNDIFKAHSYSPEFSGFQNKDLSPISSDNLATSFDFCNLVNSTSEINKSYQLHPNPASNQIIFNLNENHELRIYDVNYKFLRKFNFKKGKNKIDISNLKNGIYFISFRSKRNYYVEKVIKI